MSDENKSSGGLEIHADHSNVVVTHELGGRAIGMICGLATLLVAIGVVLGLNMARQTAIENALRENTVATDLAKHNSQQVQIQAEVNGILSAALLSRGCGK